MEGERIKFGILVWRFLPIAILLFSGSLWLCGTSHAQKKTQRTRRPRKVVYAAVGKILSPEQAEKVRAALIAGTGNDHDGPSYLAEYGDIEAVPAMLAVLKRHPLSPDGSAICTRWHCLTALRKLTKVEVGRKTEDWEKWWEDYQQERTKK